MKPLGINLKFLYLDKKPQKNHVLKTSGLFVCEWAQGAGKYRLSAMLVAFL